MLPLARVLYALQLCTVASSTGNVFIEQPGPGSILVPISDPAKLKCSVTKPYGVDWAVTLPHHAMEVTTDQRGIPKTLKERGIEAVGLTNSSSTITVSFNGTNNGTQVRCIAINSSNILDKVNNNHSVSVIFYGPPPVPTDLRASDNGPWSVVLSWTLGFIDRVPVNFTLTVINLNASSTEPVVISGIQNRHHYVFTTNTSSCDLYSYQVAASTKAGDSAPSEATTSYIPSVPDTSLIGGSLKHSLFKTELGFSLNVTFNINEIFTCPKYPISNYSLQLVDSNGSRLYKTISTSGPVVSITAYGLKENVHYVYNVIASNRFGNSGMSASVEIITNDIQNVSICHVEGNTYAINCSYVTGSNARGCVYVVSNSAGTNVTGFIERGKTGGMRVTIEDISGTVEVFASDWETDNSTSNIFINRTFSVIEECPPTGGDDTDTTIGIILAVVLAIVALTILIIVTSFLVGYKRKCLKEKMKHPLSARQRSSGSYKVNGGRRRNQSPPIPADSGSGIMNERHYDSLNSPSFSTPPFCYHRGDNYSHLNMGWSVENSHSDSEALPYRPRLDSRVDTAMSFEADSYEDVQSPGYSHISPQWATRRQITML